MASRVRSYRDLEVWQRSMDLVTEIYRATKVFPKEELYALTSQLRRAGVAIPSNIAEGAGRSGPREYRHFVSIARGSAAEVETLLEIAERLSFITSGELGLSRSLVDEVSRMLNGLRRKLG